MKSTLRAGIAVGALALLACGAGCVGSRPARNGVFNENVYLRKDFLVRPAATTVDASGKTVPVQDPGWYIAGTVLATSAPNPFVSDVFTGMTSGGRLVRFAVTQDHVEMLDPRETSPTSGPDTVPMVVDSWSAANVDLKYRVNLDGEQTNFYEENQELPWEQRQWVKLNLAKNDLSDLNVLGGYVAANFDHCADVSQASATLVPDSLVQESYDDPSQDYLAWTTQVTVPFRIDLQECVTAYAQEALATAASAGKWNVTFNIKYSMKRATPTDSLTYKPLVADEKDPIYHKYATVLPWMIPTRVQDVNSQIQASRLLKMRYDPQKDIVWYLEQGFPDRYKSMFCKPSTDPAHLCDVNEDPNVQTIRSETNKILVAAGAKHPDGTQTQLIFKNFDEDLAPGQKPREYGDVRYNFFRWSDDLDNSSGFAGITQTQSDPRTGETVLTNIVIQNYSVKEGYAQRVDSYLQSVGASPGPVFSATPWPDGPPNCKDGDTMPIVQTGTGANNVQAQNGKNTLYSKMQQYLNRPAATYGNLGPTDFIQPQDADFFNAYYKLIPYQIFADPATNPYVIPEGGNGVYGPPGSQAYWDAMKNEAEFYKRAGDIDRGLDPYDGTGPGGTNITNAAAFLNRWRELTLNHHNVEYAKQISKRGLSMDPVDAFSFEGIIQHDARHCVNGHWETKEEWVQSLVDTYWREVIWHEFGHSLGLGHNFMGSVDKNNFPTYTDAAGRTHYSQYTNSVMEYTSAASRIFDGHGSLWGPYDQGALAWIYANNCKTLNANSSADCYADPTAVSASALSGQSSPKGPWLDPLGFDDKGNEKQILSCNDYQIRYTPLCQQGDQGSTPSEIIANQIITSEWQYQWRNFRVARKYWDNTRYANTPAAMVQSLKRFMSLWVFDWSGSELADTLRRIGLKNPNPNGSDLEYFTQLTNKFNAELSQANQMVAAWHKAIIQQGSGERPFATIYDKFYGDVTQQGIILDKLFAMQGWVGLWPTDNYDQNQAGNYIAGYEGLGDSSFNSVAEDAVDSMVGGQYNVYPYFRPLAVVQFAQDTHSPSFFGRNDVRDWVGGQVFGRVQDFLDYFRNIAAQQSYVDPGGSDCSHIETCTYDPRLYADNHNEFVGPDKRVWIYAFIPDRNEYVAVQKDRNTASYVIVRAYTDDVVAQLDDGAFPGGAYGLELPMKYFLDAYAQYR